MNLNWIWTTLVFGILGYLIGSINFALLITSHSKSKQNIRELGSGNPGATNAMRTYGVKFGAFIFFLDVSKAYWFAFMLGAFQKYIPFFQTPENGIPQILPQVATIFVIIGHIWPVYYKFKGGKGAATLLGLICSISVFITMIGTCIFLIIVISSKYVSLGSIVAPSLISPLAFMCPLWDFMDSMIQMPNYSWLSFVSILASSILVIIAHWKNIVKIIQKKENKLSFKK
ncbi:MAG: glycerol-3-phosphate 1-O-acyltransferase PlsY [Metamycoplasmataceae bacterium]